MNIQVNFDSLGGGGNPSYSEVVNLSSYSTSTPYTKTLDFEPQWVVLYCVPTGNSLHAILFDVANSKIYLSQQLLWEDDQTSAWLNTYLSVSGKTFTYKVPSLWNVTARIIYISSVDT